MSKASLAGIKRNNLNKDAQLNGIFSEYIDQYVITFLENEGFILSENNGFYRYIFSNDVLIKYNLCYLRVIEEYNDSDYDVFIFVASNGIGIDIDYCWTGGYKTYYIPFEDYDTFAEAYNVAIAKLDEISNFPRHT